MQGRRDFVLAAFAHARRLQTLESLGGD